MPPDAAVRSAYPPRTDCERQPLSQGVLGDAAAAAGKTDTFLGGRRRLVRRRGKLKALVATARTILVIIWHLLANRAARYSDLGASYCASKIDTSRRTRSHVHQLEAPGYNVTLTPAAASPSPADGTVRCRAPG
jgi:transposase